MSLLFKCCETIWSVRYKDRIRRILHQFLRDSRTANTSMISLGSLNPGISNCFPCTMSCRPGVSHIASYQYLTQVLVYCPVHQINMDITRYSLKKIYKIVREEIVKPAVKISFPQEVERWMDLQVHLAVVDAADYCIKCPRCALHFATIDSVLFHQHVFHGDQAL